MASRGPTVRVDDFVIHLHQLADVSGERTLLGHLPGRLAHAMAKRCVGQQRVQAIH